MERLDPEEYDALTRIDFWVFVQRVFAELTGDVFDNNFHIERLCGEVDRVRTGTNIRLAIALPPRSLKSIIASVALPAWLLGHDPSIEIVCVSYGQELSDKLAADCRRIMLSPWYRRLFPAADLDRQAINLLATAAGGKRYSTSVGGALTGTRSCPTLFIVGAYGTRSWSIWTPTRPSSMRNSGTGHRRCETATALTIL